MMLNNDNLYTATSDIESNFFIGTLIMHSILQFLVIKLTHFDNNFMYSQKWTNYVRKNKGLYTNYYIN